MNELRILTKEPRKDDNKNLNNKMTVKIYKTNREKDEDVRYIDQPGFEFVREYSITKPEECKMSDWSVKIELLNKGREIEVKIFSKNKSSNIEYELPTDKLNIQ